MKRKNTVKAFVFKKGRFLTMRRTKTAPVNALKWDLPGGYLEFKEDPIKSIIREIKEETGFIVKDPVAFNKYLKTIAFKVFNPKGKLSISWEHDLHKWVTIDDFKKLEIPQTLRVLADKLKINS